MCLGRLVNTTRSPHKPTIIYEFKTSSPKPYIYTAHNVFIILADFTQNMSVYLRNAKS